MISSRLWQSRSVLKFCVCVLCCLAYAGRALAADVKATFSDAGIRLGANATRDVTVVKIKVEGVAKTEIKGENHPQLVDATEPALPGNVTFSFLKSDDAGAATELWYFSASIEALPFGQTQKRQAELRFGTLKQKLDYTLSNQPTASSNWTLLSPPDPWVITGWRPGPHCAALSVITGDSPATELRLKQSSLIEQSTKRPLGLDVLKLCSDSAAAQCGAFDLPAHSDTPPLYLCVAGRFHGHGNYRGAINLGSQEKPETQSLTLDIDSSSSEAKLVGFLLIVVGVIGAWVTKVYASNRLTRDQELLPLSLLRRRVDGLNSEIAGLAAPYQAAIPAIERGVAQLLKDLTTEKVDSLHYVHPATPNPFTTLAVDSAGYKSFLSDSDTKVNLLTVLLDEGAVPAVEMESRAATQANIIKALTKIDGILGQSPIPSEVQARATITQQILPELAKSIVLASGLTSINPTVAAPISFDRLLVEISGISSLVWIVTGLLTALVGVAVLILANPGFGVPLDFLYCVFWGFGIPTVAQQLSAGSVTTALGVSVPK